VRSAIASAKDALARGEEPSSDVPELQRVHFEEGMEFARRSVKDVDLQAYKDFHANQQKAKQQAGDMPGQRLVWPEDVGSILDQPDKDDLATDLYGTNNAAGNADDDDLYGQ